jgi:hypothetical protein
MLLIAHRALLNGKRDGENHPEQIKYCLEHGLDVEIDIWYNDDSFWLGHDGPQHRVDIEFIQQPGLWLHCKDIYSARLLRYYPWLNSFVIDKDDFTFTTKNWLWVSPTHGYSVKGAICVMPEDPRWKFSTERLLDFAGICSDNVYYYKDYVANLRYRRGTD